MNEFLAEMYNTRENIGTSDGSADDVEKLAEAQILSDELAAEGYDAGQLPAETLMKIAYELWGDDSALVKAAQDEEEGEEEEGEEEAGEEDETKEGSFEEKVAEADFLGRVMAHSFVNEQTEMDKEAAGIWSAVKETGKQVGSKIKSPFTQAGKSLKGAKGAYEGERWGVERMGKKMTRGSAGRSSTQRGEAQIRSRVPSGKKSMTGVRKTMGTASKSRAEALMSTMSKNQLARRLAGTGAAAGLAGAGAAGYAAGSSGKKKAASALESLAEERAMELLKEAGYEFEHNEEEVLKEAVDQRALELLDEAGYLEE